jgi:excisionase family DNA binding protein
MAETDKILSIDEAATFLKVSTKTLLKLSLGRHLPDSKAGRSWRFVRADLLLLWAGALEPAR